MTAATAEVYDEMLRDPDAPALVPLDENPWLPLYIAAYALVPADTAPIVDLGCGVGRFADHVSRHHRGHYYGCDFSEVAIQTAIASDLRIGGCPNHFTFEQLDLRDWTPDTAPAGAVFVCLEVLEHLDDDLGLVAKIPPGAPLIASVPNYESDTHVRTFPTVGAIWQRYEHLLDIAHWQRINTGSGGNALHLIAASRRNDSWE